MWSKPVSIVLGNWKQRQENHCKFEASLVNKGSSRSDRNIALSQHTCINRCWKRICIHFEACSTLGCSAASALIQEWACHYVWWQLNWVPTLTWLLPHTDYLGLWKNWISQISAFSDTISEWNSTESTILDMIVYMSLWQHVESSGDFLPPDSFFHQGHPWAMSSPYLLQRLQWPTLPAPVLTYGLLSNNISAFPGHRSRSLLLHAETTSVWHHGVCFVCCLFYTQTYFSSPSSAQANLWFLEYLQPYLLPMEDILGASCHDWDVQYMVHSQLVSLPSPLLH